MYQYQRLIRRKSPTAHTEHERAQLLALIQCVPGIQNVEIVEVHPRGGYRTRFYLPVESNDALIKALDANDWMSVF